MTKHFLVVRKLPIFMQDGSWLDKLVNLSGMLFYAHIAEFILHEW